MKTNTSNPSAYAVAIENESGVTKLGDSLIITPKELFNRNPSWTSHVSTSMEDEIISEAVSSYGPSEHWDYIEQVEVHDDVHNFIVEALNTVLSGEFERTRIDAPPCTTAWNDQLDRYHRPQYSISSVILELGKSVFDYAVGLELFLTKVERLWESQGYAYAIYNFPKKLRRVGEDVLGVLQRVAPVANGECAFVELSFGSGFWDYNIDDDNERLDLEPTGHPYSVTDAGVESAIVRASELYDELIDYVKTSVEDAYNNAASEESVQEELEHLDTRLILDLSDPDRPEYEFETWFSLNDFAVNALEKNQQYLNL